MRMPATKMGGCWGKGRGRKEQRTSRLRSTHKSAAGCAPLKCTWKASTRSCRNPYRRQGKEAALVCIHSTATWAEPRGGYSHILMCLEDIWRVETGNVKQSKLYQRRGTRRNTIPWIPLVFPSFRPFVLMCVMCLPICQK